MFAEVANLQEEPVGMVFAIVSFPSGSEPDFQHLSDLKEASKVDYYETRGREVVLYWCAMKAQEKKQIEVRFMAKIPGK